MAYDELLGMAPTARRGLVDSMVQSNRAATPTSAQEQRKAQRYSIAELNSMDLPEIKARWSADPLDTRGAGTRVLDMIDLPRNAMANLLFKATGVVKDDPRNTAALGLQRVSVADALEALGVENRIVRGVAGFVGDVAMDPLTYLGPPGWGAKGVSTAGRVARVGATGAREISAASKAAAAGKAIADPALAKFVSLSGATGDAAKAAESMYAAGKPMWKRFGEFFGADKSAEGLLGYADPLIARTGVEAEKQAAAMDFVRRFGDGTAPGIRIGKDEAGKWGVEFAKQGPGRIKAGSSLAHIPFTEYSLSVPALTGNAVYGMAAQALREVAESPDPGMAETLAKVQGLDDLARQGTVLLDQVKSATGDDRLYAMNSVQKIQEQVSGILQDVESTLLTQQQSAEAVGDPKRLLYLGRLRDTAQAIGQKIQADTGRWMVENSEGLTRWEEINPLLQQRTEELVQANVANEGNRVADARKAGALPFREEAAKAKQLADLAAEEARVARERYKQAWSATEEAMHEESNLYRKPKAVQIDPETGEPMVDAVNAPDDLGDFVPAVQAKPGSSPGVVNLINGTSDRVGNIAESLYANGDFFGDDFFNIKQAWRNVRKALSETSGEDQSIWTSGMNAADAETANSYTRKELLEDIAYLVDKNNELAASGITKPTTIDEVLGASTSTPRTIDELPAAKSNIDDEFGINAPIPQGGFDVVPEGQDPRLTARNFDPKIKEAVLRNRKKFDPNVVKLSKKHIDDRLEALGYQSGQDATQMLIEQAVRESGVGMNALETTNKPGAIGNWDDLVMQGGLTFKEIPSELKDGLKAKPYLRKYITLDASIEKQSLSPGWDALSTMGGERLLEYLDLVNMGERNRMIRTAEMVAQQGGDPNLKYLIRLRNDLGGQRIDPKRFLAIENPEGLRPGTTFKYLGNKYAVIEDGQSIIAKSAKPNKAGDILLDGVEHLFVDKGSLKHTIRGKSDLSKAARELKLGERDYISAEKLYLNTPEFAGTKGPAWDEAARATDEYRNITEYRRALEAESRRLDSLANQIERGVPARRNAGFREIESRTGIPEDSFQSMNKRLSLEQTFGSDPNVYAMPRAEDEIRKASASEAAQLMKKYLDDASAWIVDMNPEEMAARVSLADAIHRTTNAAKALADATSAPLLATMRGSDVNLRRAAELALGFTPDMLGNGVMMSMARALDGILGPDSEAVNFLSRADTTSGRLFGRRESTLKDVAREYSRWATANSPAMEQAAADRIVELAGIAEKYGVPPEKLDELNSAYLMAMFAKSDPKMAAFSPKDPIHELLKSARSGGLLDRGTNPELVSAIESLAERDAGMLADYLNVEQRMGRIGVGMDNYVPNVMTSEARIAAKSQRQSFSRALGGEPNAKGDVLEEFFAKPRSTYVYDIGGRDYLAGSLDVMRGMKSEDIARLGLDPVAEKSLMELKFVQEAFDAMPLDVQPKPRPASQFYINQLVDSGQLAMVTGGRELTKGFFEVSPPLIMAARTAAHERAKIRTYFDQVVRNLGIPYNERIAGVTAQQAGAEFKTLGGATGKISKDSSGSVRVTIGTQRFRTVSPEVINSGSDLLDTKSGKLSNILLPERAADAVESFYKVVGSDLNPIMSAIDGATKYWKSATLLHPSWTIGDLAGGMVLMAGMGITPAEMTKHGAAALKMVMRGSPETLAKMRVPLGGVEVGGEQLAKEIAEAGVLHGSRNAEAVAHILHDGTMLSPAQYSLLRNPKEAMHEIASRGQMRARAMAYSNLSGDPNFAQKAKGLVLDEVYLDRLWKPWVRLNGKVNDWLRSTAYLAMRDRGFDPTTAARAVSEGLLDMSSLTDVESNMLRRLIPFYSWMKASAVHGLRQAYQNPKYFSIYPHAARAFEEMTAGDQRVPEYARPRWMRDQVAIQVGADPSSRMAFMSGTLLPQEAAIRWASGMASPLIGAAGIQDLAAYVASGVTPLVRAPMEIGFGQEFYSGRTIRAQEGQGDFTPGEYLLSQIRPLREFGVGQVRQGAIQSAADRGILQAAGRVLIGGRFQPFDDERLKYNNLREFKEAETQIRKRVNIAEREGNKDASVQTRASLLKLYESMQSRGLTDEIPKWAREQLPQVVN